MRIDDNLPVPSAGHRTKPTKSMSRTINRYVTAYKALYSVEPVVSVDGDWIQVQGMTSRVHIRRLAEMARQLEYRVG